jgi:hypothetical protein
MHVPNRIRSPHNMLSLYQSIATSTMAIYMYAYHMAFYFHSTVSVYLHSIYKYFSIVKQANRRGKQLVWNKLYSHSCSNIMILRTLFLRSAPELIRSWLVFSLQWFGSFGTIETIVFGRML